MSLIRASANGDLAAVKKILSEGADINAVDSKGRSALIEAAWGGYSGIVKVLIDGGADVNCVDNSGFTALMRAVEEQDVSIVSMLIEKGADVNTRGFVKGSTPLMLAAEKGDCKIIEILLDNGAKINAIDQFEETALTRAYKEEQLQAVTFLESKGAIKRRDRSQFSVSDKEFRVFTKASLPKWSADAEDDDTEEDEIASEEQFDEEIE